MIRLFALLMLTACSPRETLLFGAKPTSAALPGASHAQWLSLSQCENAESRGEIKKGSCAQHKERNQSWRRVEGLAGDEVRLLALGDTGLRADDGGLHPDVLLVRDTARRVCGDSCDAALFLGDNLYPNGVNESEDLEYLERFADSWLRSGEGFLDKIYFTQGNHDWGPVFPKRDRAQRLHQAIVKLESSHVQGAAHFWNARLGKVELVVLDSNYVVRKCDATSGSLEQKFPQRLSQDSPEFWKAAQVNCPSGPDENAAAGLDSDQVARILAQDCQGQSCASRTIVAGHHPWFSNGHHGSAGFYRDHVLANAGNGRAYRALLESTIRERTQLYLSGHDHGMQAHLDPSDPTLLSLVLGSGSKVTPAGAQTVPGASRHQANMQLRAFCRLGFALIEARDELQAVRLYSLRGSAADACEATSKKKQREQNSELGSVVPGFSSELDVRCFLFERVAGRWHGGACPLLL